MIWLGILIGLILGLPIGFIKWKKPRISDDEKYIRRGLLQKKFDVNWIDGTKSMTVNCHFEVGELESTDTLSKIEVIFMTSGNSEYNSDFNKKRLTDMINHTWVDSKDIQWITSVAQISNRKIDQILN